MPGSKLEGIFTASCATIPNSGHPERQSMSRLAQLGVFSIVVGGVVFFLSVFPSAVDADSTPGIGLTQIGGILTAMVLLILGAYVFVYAMVHRGGRRTLLRDIGVRLGMTGLVFAVGATLADVLGYGSHTNTSPTGPLFGWLQAAGMMIGFLISAIGVIVYGMPSSADEEGNE
jgi:threonine/homoserine/homoserine lactone efflux protein